MEKLTIPEGMKPWSGGDNAPEDWDSTAPIMLATGHFYHVEETEGDLWWGHDWLSDGSLTGGCVVAYTPIVSDDAVDWRSGLAAAFTRPGILETMKRGLQSGGYPMLDGKLVNWSDWLILKIETEIQAALPTSEEAGA